MMMLQLSAAMFFGFLSRESLALDSSAPSFLSAHEDSSVDDEFCQWCCCCLEEQERLLEAASACNKAKQPERFTIDASEEGVIFADDCVPGKYMTGFRGAVMFGEECQVMCNPEALEKGVGDGVCDPALFNYHCHWDGGDCYRPEEPQCIEHYLGDGICDVNLNTTECDFDGGDCFCEPGSVAAGFEGSGVVIIDDKCHAVCHPEAVAMIGDGICDPDLNNVFCAWDGGDCKDPVNQEGAEELTLEGSCSSSESSSSFNQQDGDGHWNVASNDGCPASLLSDADLVSVPRNATTMRSGAPIAPFIVAEVS